MAWWYQQYAKEQPPEERRDYAQAEAQAKDKKSRRVEQQEPDPAVGVAAQTA